MRTKLDTLPAVNARAMLGAFGALGLDAREIQREAGISDGALADSDAELPMAEYVALWMSAQQRWGRPHLGAHTGARVPLGAYQLLDYLVASCETVARGLERLARYTRIVSTALDLVVDESATEGPIEVGIRVNDLGGPLLGEFTAGLIVTRFRQLGLPDTGLCGVLFAHDGEAQLEEIFPCPVRFGAGKDAILVSRAAGLEPLPRRDARLLATLERHARQLVAVQGTDLRSRASVELLRSLDSGDVRIGVVAKKLGMSARKLQALLQGEGTSFQALLDEARSALAREYLGDPDLSIAEVAYMLGYAEPSAFTRAFRRWTGQSPRAFRAPGAKPPTLR